MRTGLLAILPFADFGRTCEGKLGNKTTLLDPREECAARYHSYKVSAALPFRLLSFWPYPTTHLQPCVGDHPPRASGSSVASPQFTSPKSKWIAATILELRTSDSPLQDLKLRGRLSMPVPSSHNAPHSPSCVSNSLCSPISPSPGNSQCSSLSPLGRMLVRAQRIVAIRNSVRIHTRASMRKWQLQHRLRTVEISVGGR